MTCLLLCLIFGSHGSRAQSKISSTWYFGQYAGISFKDGEISPLNDSRMIAGRSSAVISDPTTGELLFYTDGVTVWNRFHEIMPNGTGLKGDPTTSQGALVVPAPGRPGVYYLFNSAPTSASDVSLRCLCLYYSIIDMRAGEGLGDVTTKNEFVLGDITEHLTATLDCRGDGWWIIVRSRVSRHFYSLHLNSDYLESTPVVSAVGTPQLDVKGAGNLQVSPDNRRLLLTSASGNSQVFDFDGQTGRISGGMSLFGLTEIGEHFGAAFSPDGRRAYVTVSNADAGRSTMLYQFSLDKRTPAEIAASKSLIADLSETSSWVPLQLGPDGRIYVGIPGTRRLDVIDRPNASSDDVGFRREAVTLTGSVRTGLPNIPTTLLFEKEDRNLGCLLPVANFIGQQSICEGASTSFTDRSSGNITSWNWLFEGAQPTTSTERNPSRVTYPKAGTHRVRLIVGSVYGNDTVTSNIEVLSTPKLIADSLVIACPDSPLQLRASGAERYQWSPSSVLSDASSATPTVRVRTTTLLSVVGFSSSGCADTAKVLVRVPATSVSGNVTICSGASAQLRATGGRSYRWSPSAGLSDPTSEAPTAAPRATTTYTVAIDNGECTIIDSVRVTVLDSLIVRIQGPSQACVGDTIILSATAGTSFEWDGPGILDQRANTTRLVLPSGGCRVRLNALSGACKATDELVINPLAAPQLRVQPGVRICAGGVARLTVDAGDAKVRWYPSTGLDMDTGTVVTATPRVSTTYMVEATNSFGCITRDTIRVQVTQTPNINAGADLSICAGVGKRLLASGFGDEFSWSPADGLSDPTTLAPVASPTVTTTYVLRARIGDCEHFDTVTVYVSRLRVRLTGDTLACRGNAIRIQASGAWQYRWSPTVGLADSTSPTQTIIADSTITYTVVGVDGLGCTETQSITITVRDTVTIVLSAGSVSAEAGQDSVGIPIIVDVPANMLPLRIDEMRVTLVHDASAFFPKSTDRGELRVSIRGNQRLSHLRIEDVDIISPRQRITSIRGVVLAGQVLNADMTWENVEWEASKCPNSTVLPGVLFVNGCGIMRRLVKTYTVPKVGLRLRPRDHAIDVDVQAEMPGEYDILLTTLEGSTVYETSLIIQPGDKRSVADMIDMSERSSGAYYLMVRTPVGQTALPVMWMP
ncbi:MAG: PKD domain-containing protein [Candidatus Kapabacteria bacterium]|nr:PKD domain-containing protein [Candidatus Kapabacteria bacterium]